MKLLVLRCWWVSLVVLAACFSPQFEDGQIKCGPNKECPPGLECYGSVCRIEDPGIDGAVGFPLTITLGGNMMGTVTSAPGGINCGTDCSETYASGTMVTLTAAANSGATFVGWAGACSGTGACTITVATAINVTANFAVDNALVVALAGNGSGVVSSNPAGINCGSDCMEQFAPNTMVTLTASPATGSSFDGWSGGGCTGTGTCSVTADVAKMVTASFSLTQHSLTVTPAGTGLGTVASVPAGIDCGMDCTESLPYNTMVTLTATPATGSTFAGWTGGGCTGMGTCQVTMTQATQVTATFTLTTFVLTVNKVGNGTVTSTPSGINCGGDCSDPYNYNTMVTLSATPAAGSTFTGWSGGVCTGTASCIVTMTQATTVTATFTLNTYSVGVLKDGNGNGTVSSSISGIDCGSDCAENYNFGTTLSLTATPATGSTFTGWSGGCTGTGACNITVANATTVTATFTLTQHNLTVGTTGTGSGSISGVGIDCGLDCMQAYDYGTMVTLTAAPAAGSTFAGWSGTGCSGTGTCELTMTQARSMQAQFTLTTHLVSVTPAGTGAGTVSSTNVTGISCGSDCNEVYGYNTVVTLSATPAAGSVFTGWSGAGCSGTGSCSITVQNAATVTATFSITSHTLTVNKTNPSLGTVTSNVGGINCGATCSASYTYNSVVTLTAVPTAGNTFTGWSGGGCTGNGTCQVTVQTATTVTATFTAGTAGLSVTKAGTGAGTVTSNDNPATISCGTACNGTFTVGSTVVLTATPSAGSTFSSWSGGACNGSTMTTCSITITATPVAVTATFTLTQQSLTVTRNGSGTGTVTSNDMPQRINCGTDCNETVPYGTSVTLSATPAANATFAGWTGGGCSGTGTCTVAVTATTQVFATFNLVQHNLTVKVENGGTVTSMPMGINCGTDCDQDYNDGQVVMLLATAAPGYTFAGWQDDCAPAGSSTMCSVTMNGDKAAYAQFAPIQYQLRVDRMPAAGGDVYSINDAGIDCGTDCSEFYDYNTVVPLKVSPASGYTFTGWSGACTGTGDCEPTMDNGKTVTANFVQTTYALTVNLGGNGSGAVTSNLAGINCGGTPSDCSEVYIEGTNVTLTATPSTGTNFGGWSGCTTFSGNTCTVAMNAAKSVTATFTLQQFSLNLSKAGTGSGGVVSTPAAIACGPTCSSASSSFNYNTNVALVATPAAGSTFTSWSGCGSISGSTCNVTMTQARNVQVTFTTIPPNYVFVTSTGHTGNLGGLAGADAICQARATAGGMTGTYRAYLSTSTVNAPSRISSARGWIRKDGKPVADQVSDITSGHLFYPIKLDETGAVVPENTYAMTATANNGTYFSVYGACGDWTSTSGNALGGFPSANSTMFTHYAGPSCAAMNRLYCFGVDNVAVVAPPTVNARRAFISSGWTPGGGLAAADAVCASDASAAGLSGTYLALLATSTASAISRFDTSSASARPWARPDNTLLAPTAAALASASLTHVDTSPNSNAANTVWFSSSPIIWTGAPDLTSTGSATATCGGTWTQTGSTAFAGIPGFTHIQSWRNTYANLSCTNAYSLVCLQQ